MNRGRILSAIDIGSSKIAVALTTVDKEGEASVIGVSLVESSGIRKGQIVDINQAVASIAKAVELAEKMAGATLGTAVLSVSGAHVTSLNSKGVVAVAQPEGEISANDIKRVIEAARAISLPQAREIIHVLPRDYTVDGQSGIKDPGGMSGVRLEVETQIVTGSTTAIHNLVKCISEVGIDTEAVIFAGLASSEAVLTDTEKELGVVLVDIGAGTSAIAIFVDGALSYSAVLPVGARNVTNDLAVGLRVGLESAEKIKLFLSQKNKTKTVALPQDEYPSFVKSETTKASDEIDVSSLELAEDLKKVSKKTLIDGIIKPRLTEIFTLVGLEIQKSGFVGMTPAGMVITGGGAQTAGIMENARSRLGMPVRIGYPTGLSGLVDEIKGPEAATLVGLLKFTIRSPGSEIRLAKGSSQLSSIPSFGKITGKFSIGSFIKNIAAFLKNFLP